MDTRHEAGGTYPHVQTFSNPSGASWWSWSHCISKRGLVQALQAHTPPHDWPPSILNISTHNPRKSFLPEYVLPPAAVAAAMLLPLNVSDAKQADLPGQKVQMNLAPLIVVLAIAGTVCAAAVSLLAIKQRHCTIWPSRIPRHRLEEGATTRKTSSRPQVRTCMPDLSKRLYC